MDIQTDQREDKKVSSKTRVKVAIRVRPMIPKQIASNQNSCVEFKNHNEIILGKERNYKFDHVFSPQTEQCKVYETCVRDLVMSCFQGYNAAILAYGQTGSGKTFTMGTALSTLANQKEQGIVPRVIAQIFKQVKAKQKQSEFIVKASFLQIYNQQILDLLIDQGDKNKNKDHPITIRQQKDGSVSLINITEQKVTSVQDMMELLERGGYHRTTASTLMNDASSRSHAIFTIFIQQHKIDDLYQNQDKQAKEKLANKSADLDDGFTTAKFFFVDLAGSQRAKKTGASGATLKEGININMGLLELGNVISALSTIQKKQDQFITYRNSKLTRILQECLGGNSNTYMIACVSPAQSNYQESLNTLKYASKAMNIKNKPIKNIDPHTAQVTQLKQRIHQLEVQNRKLKSLLSDKGVNVQEKALMQSSDIVSDELKKMKKIYLNLQKKYQEVMCELRQQRKQKSSLQLKIYTSKRERDILALKLQEMGVQNLNTIQEQFGSNQKIGVLNQLSSKIQSLEATIKDKDKINMELQKQYQKLQDITQKDQKILISKNTAIYQLVKQNQTLKKTIKNLQNQVKESKNSGLLSEKDIIDNSMMEDSRDYSEKLDQSVLQDPLDCLQALPPEALQLISADFNAHQINFSKNHAQTQSQLKCVSDMISQKQNYLQQISKSQINLEYQLIQQMKEQYHTKISMLEKQKSHLIKIRDQSSASMNPQQKNKFMNRIQNLQSELKDFRKRAKQQKNLQKLVNNQSGKIKQLAEQIRKFKSQKTELTRKIKDDKDGFQKFKSKKIKELMKAKKQNLKKDNQIRKLTLQNNRKVQSFKKKQEELNRAKRVNQALKHIVKPSNSGKRYTDHHKNVSVSSLSTQHKSDGAQLISEKYCEQHIQHIIKLMVSQIDQQNVIQKYEKKLKELNDQIKQLLSQDSQTKLKLQRLTIKQQNQQNLDQNEQQEKQRLQLGVNDLKQRITNAQDSLGFCNKKYEELLKTNSQIFFDIDSQVMYKKQYENNDNLKVFVKVLLASLRNILSDNISLYQIKDNLQLQSSHLKQNINEIRQRMQQMQTQHQLHLQKLRQEMLVRYYSNSSNQQQANTPTSASLNNYKKLQQKQKKNYEKKIVDLTKTNRQISHQVELWKRKCSVVQEKYQNIRSLLSKDRSIGLGEKQKGLNQSGNFDDKRKGNKNSLAILEEIDEMKNQMDLKLRKNHTYNEQATYQKKQKIQQNNFDYSVNQWECLGKIDAHNSSVLSIATHANMLISTSTKSLKIWDLETSKIISDLSGAHLTGLVKYVMVDPERNIMLTACEKMITIWDLITLNVECSLKAHKDQVRTMHIVNDILFTGGKGLANSGSLLMWDLRCLDPNKPQQEKERNQDIFTFASKGNSLYYGTRNHHVRRMDLNSLQVLAPFQPPHMDTVTGLAIIGDRMVSGSKDKNLRLWDLEHSVGNLKSTTHAFNDYVTTIKNDKCYPMFYAGSKDGQIKIGSVKNDRIVFNGGILAHTQSVNAISSIQDSCMVASASADRTIKLWKPSQQTAEKMQKQFL